MNNNNKIFAYSDSENYVVCTCNMTDENRAQLRQNLKNTGVSCEVLHTFDNMLSNNAEEIINLSVIMDELYKDMERVSYVTSDFLDKLDVIDRYELPADEASEEWRCLQLGTFNRGTKSEKTLKTYASSIYNNKIIKSIGYNIIERFNKKQQKGMEKRKILSAE